MTGAAATSEAAPLAADVLVVGAGIAGMCAALGAAPRQVLLLCPAAPADSASSSLAQGGIAAPLGPADSVHSHVLDTLAAAAHSADRDVVERVVGAAPAAIAFLEGLGVSFDRDERALSLHLEAGHSHARVLHAAGDRSGAAIVAALWTRVRGAGHVRCLTGWRALRLLRDGERRVAGALVVDAGGRRWQVRARDTVLATGGLGQLFERTTNAAEATGDGLAMALEAGARTAALEFVQFHPTALAVPADPLPLLTEALRGAGAVLVTQAGARVMAGVHPRADLAPRDVVARAVYERALRGERVLLDATAVFRGPQAHAFPQARAIALRHGLDPAREPLPVTAAAHYHMGGVLADGQGRTSLDGLWACGEVACTGLHGANRLASNSLLEAVHFGRAVGAALAAMPGAPLHPAAQVPAATAGGAL
ncbi:MAG: FAD-binding protein, partial [Proteobacteria bacterium]|nr:FAD-binding protein [Pseudomonadota bacterium]